MGAGEMAQWLKAPVRLLTVVCNSISRESDSILWPLWALHTQWTYIHVGTHSYTLNKQFKKHTVDRKVNEWETKQSKWVAPHHASSSGRRPPLALIGPCHPWPQQRGGGESPLSVVSELSLPGICVRNPLTYLSLYWKQLTWKLIILVMTWTPHGNIPETHRALAYRQFRLFM